jgi:serine/threonine protein kinase
VKILRILIKKTKFSHFLHFFFNCSDIALRNCVITKETIKLSSIALCKDKHANEYYKLNNRMIPLRHCAPELLDAFTYSTATDVYACAMTIWEIFHSAAVPFEAIGNEEFLQKLQGKTIDYTALLEGGKIPSDLQKTLVRKINNFKRNIINVI